MKKLEFSAGFLLLVFSLFVCWEARKLGIGSYRTPGPGLVPFSLGLLLCTLTVFYLLKTWQSGKMEQESHLWQGLRWGKVMVVFSLLFAYALLLETVGFHLCTLLFLMALFSWVDKQKWYWLYIGSPVITFLFYAVFELWLKIQLPAGFLRM